jgi:hypothetical protein
MCIVYYDGWSSASCLHGRWTPSKPESEKGLDEESVEFQCPRGRANRAFPPSGLAKIFGDDAGVVLRHWLIFGDRLYQRASRSKEFVPIGGRGPCRRISVAEGAGFVSAEIMPGRASGIRGWDPMGETT